VFFFVVSRVFCTVTWLFFWNWTLKRHFYFVQPSLQEVRIFLFARICSWLKIWKFLWGTLWNVELLVYGYRFTETWAWGNNTDIFDGYCLLQKGVRKIYIGRTSDKILLLQRPFFQRTWRILTIVQGILVC